MSVIPLLAVATPEDMHRVELLWHMSRIPTSRSEMMHTPALIDADDDETN